MNILNTSAGNNFVSSSVTRQYCVVAAIKNNLSYDTYMTLAQWLDCYKYVLPNERKVNVIPKYNIKCSLDCYKLANLISVLECGMSATEQLIFLNFIGKGYVTKCE